MNLKFISIFLITFFMVVCSPCIFAENVNVGDLSFADAVVNDSADVGDVIVDNGVVNASVDVGDVIVDNGVVNGSVDVADAIIDNVVDTGCANDVDILGLHSPLVVPDSLDEMFPRLLHIEFKPLKPFIYEDNVFGTGNLTVHSVKLRVVDQYGNGVSNAPVSFHTYYGPYGFDGSVRYIDLFAYSSEQSLLTDDNGYVVVNYAISSNPEISVYCWVTLYLSLFTYCYWDGINHSIYDK